MGKDVVGSDVELGVLHVEEHFLRLIHKHDVTVGSPSFLFGQTQDIQMFLHGFRLAISATAQAVCVET